MKKIFPILIVIVLIFAGGAYYLMNKQTADPTAWKTYTNKEFGFSFQYPPTFTVSEHAYTPEENAIDVTVSDPATGAGYVTVMVWGRQSDIDTAAQFFTGPYPKEIPPTGNNSAITVVERTLNGSAGVERYGYGGEGTSYDDAFLYKNKYLWEIYLDPVAEGRIAEEREPGAPVPKKDIYERILSSIHISS